MINMAVEILSPKQLKSLKEHKYSAQGSSICEPFMQVFWRWLVEQIPLTWAPNSITLVGLILNIVSTLILTFYTPDGTHEAPTWVFLLCGLGLFIYQALDAIDGKQARRTKTNTPLGELFDHGCDSLSTVFVMVGACAAIKLGRNPNIFLYEICLSELCFYIAHWRAYVTGTMTFGAIDVTEGQITVITIYTLCAINPSFFDITVPVIGMALRHVTVLISIFISTIYVIKSFQVILHGGAGKNKSTVAGTSTIFPALPIGVVLLLQVIIAQKSPVYLEHPCLYLLSFGLVTSKMTNSLVVAHMTKSEMKLIDSCLIGPMMLFLNQYFNSIIPEYFLLWIMCIYSAQDLIVYSMNVCGQICDSLNIYCFDITQKPNANGQSYNGKKTK